MERSLRVLLAAAEVSPYAKVGGLADVAGALPKALARLGVDVRMVMPKHGSVARFDGFQPVARGGVATLDGQEDVLLEEGSLHGVPVYMVASSRFFGRPQVYGEPDDLVRYHYFTRAVLELPKLLDWRPDIFHLNDWHTAAVAFGLRNRAWGDPFYHGMASLLTIHNLRYRGPDEVLDILCQGIYYADAVNTVSPTYAREIMTPEYGEGLHDLLRLRQDRLSGIINGIDLDEFNPATDPQLAATFDVTTLERRVANKRALQERSGLLPDPEVPLIGMVGRLTDQKGFDLVAQVLNDLVQNRRVQVVILGAGEERYHALLRDVAQRHPQQVALHFAFDLALAQLIYGGSDLFLMPSRFEPCGLGQMIALRYGSVPVVRATGGLADTVADVGPDLSTGTGFVFRDYQPGALLATLGRALDAYRDRDAWRGLVRRGMQVDNSWDQSAARYASLYRSLLAGRREG
ncbi:MAG: glycogen synthase [Chloroflexi bacterium]|nr:glycogen synthase [Chloroflexota bacterium]